MSLRATALGTIQTGQMARNVQEIGAKIICGKWIIYEIYQLIAEGS